MVFCVAVTDSWFSFDHFSVKYFILFSLSCYNIVYHIQGIDGAHLTDVFIPLFMYLVRMVY